MQAVFLCTWLALGPAGRTLYVAQDEARRLVAFDVQRETVSRSAPLSFQPTGLAAGAGRLYLTSDGKVHMFDGALRPAGEIRAGRGSHAPVLSRDGRRLFLLNRFENSVSVVDLQGKSVSAVVAVSREPFAAALTPDGAELWVASLLPGQPSLAEHVAAQVCVVDVAAAKSKGCLLLPNGSTGVRGIAVAPDGRHAFVTHLLARYPLHTTQLEQGWMNTNAVTIVELASHRLLATFLLDDVDDGAANPWAVALSPDGRKLLVTHAGTHELSLIDTDALLAAVAREGNEVSGRLSFLLPFRRRIALPGKGPRALVAAGETVFVAEAFSETLAAVPIDGSKRPRSLTLGPERPLSAARRGEMFFHDAGSCFQRWQSCSSCHPDARTDGLNWDLMNDGIGNPKNTRSLVWSHKWPPVMWTGVRPSAEYAIRSGMRHIQFSQPDEEEASAIEAYLKSLNPAPAPPPPGGKEAADRGRKLFFSREVGCAACHPPPLYTDRKLHEVGTEGAFDFTLDGQGRRVPQSAFKTPSLIEAWRTAPYLHDGRYADLQEVLTKGNHGDRRGRTSHLTPAQIRDLAAFVLSL